MRLAITSLTGDQTQTLQLSDQHLTIEQAAGWMTEDELPGSFSYPLGFPLNDNNKRFVQHAYRPDHARPEMELPVLCRLNGILYRRCTLSYRVTDGRGDGFLKIDNGEVYDKLRKLDLFEVFSAQLTVGNIGGKTLVQRLNEIVRLEPGQFPWTLFPIRNEAFFEADLAGKLTGFQAQPYLNAWKAGSFVVDTSVKGFPVVPQFYLTWILQEIFTRANYRIVGDWIGRAETQRLTLLNLTALDAMPAGPAGLIIGHRVRPGFCLPAMSVPDFLKAIKQRYGLVFTFNANDQTVSIRRFADVLKQPTTQDLSPFQLKGYGIDPPLAGGYTLQEAIDPADELFKDDQGRPIVVADSVLGKGRQEISLKAGSTQMIYERNGTLASSPKWLIPTVRQPGNLLDPIYKDSDRYIDKSGGGLGVRRNDVGLRLLSFRGLVPDSAGALYPLGTSDVRNGRQEVIAGAEATTLAGRAGIYRKSLRPYYFFRDQARKVTEQLLLPVAVLASLKLDEPVSLLLDGIRRSYLPDRYQADSPDASGLSKTRLTLYSLPTGLDESAEVDDPLVWLELISVNKMAPGPIGGNTLLNARQVTTVTVKCWTNAQRTAPALVSNLPITLRRKKTWTPYNSYVPAKAYEETLATYYITGSSFVIETDWLTKRAYASGSDADIFEILFSLDPGDGYNIIL